MVEESGCRTDNALFGHSIRNMKEGDQINILWIPLFYPLNILKETPIDPLKTLDNTHCI